MNINNLLETIFDPFQDADITIIGKMAEIHKIGWACGEFVIPSSSPEWNSTPTTAHLEALDKALSIVANGGIIIVRKYDGGHMVNDIFVPRDRWPVIPRFTGIQSDNLEYLSWSTLTGSDSNSGESIQWDEITVMGLE